MNRNLIFISGYTKLPKGTTAYELYGGLIIALIVEKDSGAITEFECSLVTDVAKHFLENIVVGESLKNFPKIERDIDRLYFGAAKKAVISGLNICSEKYEQIINNLEVSDEM